jgi:7,8-dihydropterin-6-yl-methyl-4-(beta-D-ribofuranosyl)aminobenzene 5'-phosphate synthase
LTSVLVETGARSVFAHPSAFALKHSKKTGELRSIGMPANRETLESAGMQLRTCTEPVEVAPGVLATGPIPRVTGFEQVPAHFLTASGEKADLVPDGLEDDQALILGPRSAPVVVLGCAHSGIVNTLETSYWKPERSTEGTTPGREDESRETYWNICLTARQADLKSRPIYFR